jgi:hypothetical protein
VTVVADAGMVSAGNQQRLEEAGLSFILGARIPDVPYAAKTWRAAHSDEEIADGQIFTQRWPAGPKDKRRDQVIYYQYRQHAWEHCVPKTRKPVQPRMSVTIRHSKDTVGQTEIPPESEW